MKRIVIYVSDHGFGHAARTIGLLREFKNTNHEIIVKNSNAFNFLKKSLPDAKIVNFQTDVGPLTNISKKSDSDKTFKLYTNWIKNEKKWIQNELDYFQNKKLDLVISDISPLGIRFANKINVPSITIANFSWIDILEKFPFHKNKEKILDWLNESFQMTDLGIKTPLSMALKGIKNIKKSSLICRSKTISNNEIFQKLNLPSKPITVYLDKNSPSKIIFLTNKSYPISRIVQNSVKINNKIIKNFSEAQNLISSSRLTIAKPGYGIISECINFRCPILLIPRKNYPEDKFLCESSKKLGIGTILDLEKENFMINIPKINFKELKNKIKEKEIEKLEKLPHANKIIKEFLYN